MTAAAMHDQHVAAPHVIPRLLGGTRRDRATTLAEHLARFGAPAAPRDLIAMLAEAGLCGRGGGGFPTAQKLRAVAGRRGRPVVVVNAAEGEPACSKDKALVRLTPHLVLDGAAVAAHVLGAREVVVAIADTARPELQSLTHALAERRRFDPIDTTVAVVPDAFVTGEETALLRAIVGEPAKPTLKPPFPFERGLDGAPTLVQNAETLAHIALIARFGPSWFRSAGSADAPGTALVTLSGAVAQPGVREIELGCSLGDLVLRAGGATEAVSAFLVGGYFGHWIRGNDAAALRLTPEVLGAGAIVAFPEHACAAAECARVTRYLARQSAGQCGPCVYGLDAIAGALERLARGDRQRRADGRAQILRWAGQVRGRGACRHPDGAVRFVESALTVFEREFELHVQHGRCREPARSVLPLPPGAAW
jgi:NADH:ubiquinone oxidoreductase subunit F (NADH-binding)